MADTTITAANVRAGSLAAGAKISTVTAGESITAGQIVYKKASDSEYYKADANSSAETAGSSDLAVALTNAGDGEALVIQTKGLYTVGGTVVLGQIYVASATAGGLAPASDGASGWYTSQIGTAASTTTINISINVTGYVRA